MRGIGATRDARRRSDHDRPAAPGGAPGTFAAPGAATAPRATRDARRRASTTDQRPRGAPGTFAAPGAATAPRATRDARRRASTTDQRPGGAPGTFAAPGAATAPRATRDARRRASTTDQRPGGAPGTFAAPGAATAPRATRDARRGHRRPTSAPAERLARLQRRARQRRHAPRATGDARRRASTTDQRPGGAPGTFAAPGAATAPRATRDARRGHRRPTRPQRSAWHVCSAGRGNGATRDARRRASTTDQRPGGAPGTFAAPGAAGVPSTVKPRSATARPGDTRRRLRRRHQRRRAARRVASMDGVAANAVLRAAASPSPLSWRDRSTGA